MHQRIDGYTYQAPAVAGCSRKKCTKFTHHNFETLRNSYEVFSKKCWEI